MKRENRNPTPRELQAITTPGFVRRVVRLGKPQVETTRADEEILGRVHEQDLSERHDREDEYGRGV